MQKPVFNSKLSEIARQETVTIEIANYQYRVLIQHYGTQGHYWTEKQALIFLGSSDS